MEIINEINGIADTFAKRQAYQHIKETDPETWNQICKIQKEKQLEATKKYMKSEAGKAARKKYEQSHKEQIKNRKNQYYQDNKDTIKQHRQQYAQTHEQKIQEYRNAHKQEQKEYMKQYLETNKIKIATKKSEKFECECGGQYTASHKGQHYETWKHHNYINKKKDEINA